MIILIWEVALKEFGSNDNLLDGLGKNKKWQMVGYLCAHIMVIGVEEIFLF
jgi:transcription elongation factor GreA-like protein